MHQNHASSNRETRRVVLHGIGIATLVALALLVTNPYFNVLEDEAAIVVTSQAPAAHIMTLFTAGFGQHLHPPLSDLLLHFWLPVAGLSLALIRLPFILCYSAELLILALTARRLSGDAAFYTTMLVGALWPFGFHFGRVAGWYSFCFLLVASLTLAYLRFLEEPNWPRWLFVVGLGLALVWSNYFGWAVIGLIAVDLSTSLPIRRALKYLVIGMLILSVGFAPLWVCFSRILLYHSGAGSGSPVAQLLLAAFSVYSLFVSESVAPWFWKASILCGAAVMTALICTPLLTRGKARRMYFGLILLLTAMACAHILVTKSLLFISGWMLITLGCALANAVRPHLRAVLAASLAFIAIVGWAGTFSRKYYSAPHFIEPWPQVADSAAKQVAEGHTVIANEGPFLFYLNKDLYRDGVSTNHTAGYPVTPKVISVMYDPLPDSRIGGTTMFVRGTNPYALERTEQAEIWLQSHCRLISMTHLFPDSGYELKKQFFPRGIDGRYRITIEQFDCLRPSVATR